MERLNRHLNIAIIQLFVDFVKTLPAQRAVFRAPEAFFAPLFPDFGKKRGRGNALQGFSPALSPVIPNPGL